MTRTPQSTPADSALGPDAHAHGACDVCGSLQGLCVMRFDQASYRQCADCGLVFADPMPADHDILNESAFTERLDNYTAKVADRRDYNRAKIKRFTRYRQTGNWLELGCSAGAALLAAQDMGWTAKGVDPCKAVTSFAIQNLGLDVFCGEIEQAGLPDHASDVVFTDAVLEHLRHPLSTLRECRRVLRPGGVFYGDTVNWDSYTRRLLGRHWAYLSPDAHLHLYTPKSLTALFRRAGFRQVRVWTTGVRVKPRAPSELHVLWHRNLLKGPLSFLTRFTGKGDHIQVLART